jgi:hypothetical protein
MDDIISSGKNFVGNMVTNGNYRFGKQGKVPHPKKTKNQFQTTDFARGLSFFVDF